VGQVSGKGTGQKLEAFDTLVIFPPVMSAHSAGSQGKFDTLVIFPPVMSAHSAGAQGKSWKLLILW